MRRSPAGKTTPSADGDDIRFQLVGLEDLITAAVLRACAGDPEESPDSDPPSQTHRG